MDKQEIIEGNKLIAEFMGWTFEIIPDEYGGELIAYYEGKSRWRGCWEMDFGIQVAVYLDKLW